MEIVRQRRNIFQASPSVRGPIHDAAQGFGHVIHLSGKFLFVARLRSFNQDLADFGEVFNDWCSISDFVFNVLREKGRDLFKNLWCFSHLKNIRNFTYGNKRNESISMQLSFPT